MSPTPDGERASKKRKLNGKHVLKVGDKVISLEGYFNPPAKKEPPKKEEQPQDASEKPETEAPEPAAKEAEKRDKAFSTPRKHEFKRPHDKGRPRSDQRGPRWRDDPALLKIRQKLPMWAHREDIQARMRQKDVLLLVGETGSGKSTQVPQFLVREPWCRRQMVTVEGREVSVGGMIAVTQPRRVAATTLAHRVSREAGTPLGESREGMVGYSVRFDHQVPKGTKIKFLTEGMLLQELLRDPSLKQYSAVVVDEIHERSVDVDLVSGFLKQILMSDRKGRGGIPLKIVVMSATADVERIHGFFSTDKAETSGGDMDVDSDKSSSVEILKIQGRQYPVKTVHTPKPVPDIQEALLKTIFKIHTEEPLPGDILAFLTGQEEIESTQALIEEYAATLASNVPKVKVLPLFGQLSMEGQHAAFQPIKGGFTRKIVLATNIAETSVTVPGVRYVVDGGKAKVKQFRARLGMESLLAKPISKSSAIQRTGRAGREGPGKCFRLYTEGTFGTLQETDLPEILRIDVLGAVLTMKARGIDDVLGFPLMDTPDIDAIERALISLHGLGALADDGTITEAGRKMAGFPISAPLGAVLLASAKPEFDCVLEAIDVIACITSGDDIFHQLQSEEQREEIEELRKELYRREGDIMTYLTTMQQYAAENADRIEWCKKRKVNIRNMRTALNIRKQLRSLCLKEGLLSEAPPPDPQPFSPLPPEQAEALLKCFLRGFVSKTAVLAPDASYVTSQGKHVVAIHPSSVLHGQKKEAIMFLEHVFTQKNYAKKVSVIQANWIVEALESTP
ncbi:helicase associated domain-containing protein [Colletotrichum truncatum]|uniref:Helicase associated domain-containing protein n=1 Tax=Colletotrichum truncatum TaxID=5467 RepID=A0ACC3Z489_COLTU|nr:helicase associated domain-containing protein [Colletotrichum truncatum]KAF6795758.1 helicase associated domain-containing protein [Colletotrichum truncatum]